VTARAGRVPPGARAGHNGGVHRAADVIRRAAPAGCPLEGTWRIARTIGDLRADVDASFAGIAVIAPAAPDEPWLTWREKGELVQPGHRGQATRDLRIVRTPTGPWEVLFSDGSPFHDLDLRPGAGPCAVVHLCGADRYDGRFILSADGAGLRVTWRVRGPRKDLVIESDYRRSA
jgi:hypothetical protein